jgi:hypothetical protein
MSKFEDFVYGPQTCIRKTFDVSGNVVTIKQDPSWFCYAVVLWCVIDTLRAFSSRELSYAIPVAFLHAVNAYIMMHHCNTCQAWRGFWMTLAIEIVGKMVIEMAIA